MHNKKDNLWIKWITSNYLNGQSIWEFEPRRTDSKFFRYVAKIRNDLVDFFFLELEG